MSSLPALPGYRVLAAVGAGGMAELFLAERETAEGARRRVVLKRILPAFARDPQFRHMFVHEARVALQLTHRNLVQVYDFRETDDTWVLEMEYVEGCDLKRLLAGGPLPLGPALYVAAELLRGLDYAHRRPGTDGMSLEIVHRDVAPGNILVSREGEVKLTDFGLSRSREQLERSFAGVKGTFAFMAPEQAEGLAVDRRADLFAVGAVLHAMLVGRSPFEADGPLATLERVRAAKVPPAGAPPDVETVLGRAMAREREERFESAAAMREAIEAAAAAAGVRLAPEELAARVRALAPAERFVSPAPPKPPSAHEQTTPAAARPKTARLERRPRRVGLAIAGASAIGVLAVAGAAHHLAHPTASPSPPPAPVAAATPPARPTPSPPPATRAIPTPAPEARAPAVRPAARPRPAYLTINADPWAYVSVDGKRRGMTPLVNVALAPGAHELTFDNPPLGASRARRVKLASGEHQTIIEKLTP